MSAPNSAGGQQQGGAQAGGPPPFDAESLVYHADLFVIGLIALVIFWRLPRAVARFTQRSEWTNGLVLRKVSLREPSRSGLSSNASISYPISNSKDEYSYSSHSSGAMKLQVSHGPTNYPMHIPTYIRILRPLASPLQARLSSGYTVGQALLLFLFFAAVIYLPFYKSNPFSDPVREGFISMALIPFVFIFAAKNNIIGGLMGLGYEKLNFVHRFAGRLLVLMVNLHSFGYIYKWAISGTFYAAISKPTNAWGLVGAICMNVLFFLSVSWMRSRCYNIFLTSHIIAYTLVIPAAWLHKEVMHPYLLAAIAILVFDRLMRAIKSRITMALIRPIPELALTRVEIPNINAGWRAGQHVRLRVVSSAMGFMGWSDMHPFTIASISGSNEGMVLMCKKTGTWTSSLYEAAKMGGYALSAGVERKVTVHVEGPYGGPGHMVFSSYSAAMLVAGGSGITFALAALQDLIQKDLTNESRVKVIELVWMIQDPTSLHPLLPTFGAIIDQAAYTKVRISVHYTRAHALETKLPFSPDYFPPGLTLSAGRPRLYKVLDATIGRTVTLGAGAKDNIGLSGVLVGVCGPASLGDECQRAVSMVDPYRRDQVGGIEIHEEAFSW